MKNLILLFALFIGSQSFAQGMGDLTVYSNTGNKFYVVLNGIRQNDQPETNVMITGLTNQWYECKIMSANNNFTIEKKVMVKFDTLVTYRIVEKKGKYKMKYFSQTALGTLTAQPDQSVVKYHSTENPINTATESKGENMNTSTNTNTTGGMTSTTTTTTTTSRDDMGTATSVNSGQGESVNINMNISENGNGADVNVSMTGTEDPNRTNINTNTSSDMNSTTTSTSSSSSNDGGMGSTYHEETTTTTSTTSTNNGSTYYEETSTTTTSTSGNGFGSTTTTTTNEGNMYQDDDMTVTMDNNCYTSDDEVNGLVKQIKNETFADDQARIANMAAENKCMNSDQIAKVANSFTFEDNKLAFLKKAYGNCTDKSNYYKVIETLTFSSDKEELQNYINSAK